MPFLNKAIRSCNKKTLLKLFVAIILVFSVFDRVVNKFWLNGGYSFIWLVLLYVLGAIIKKCEIGKNIKKINALLGIIILCVITYFFKIYGYQITFSKNIKINDLFVSYISPTILGVAVLHIILFSKINFGKFFKKIIKFSAPAAFSVYILNNHRLFWENTMKDLFISISNKSVLIIVVCVIGFSIAFVIASILIDKLRQLFFKVLHIDELIKKISNAITNLYDKLITKIFNKRIIEK